MDNRRYKNIVYNHLRENKAVSLKILLEEEDQPEESNDLFDMPNDESEEESSEEKPTQSEPEKDADVESESGSNPEEDAVDLASFETIVSMIDQITSARSPDDANYGGIIDNYTRELSSFVLSEADLEKPEEVIDDLETALNKSDGIINRARIAKEKLKSGIKVDVDSEVSKAIDKLVHFREKVDIIDLIEDLFCNKIKLTAPAEDIDRNIEEFKEKYAEEVHRQRAKIDLPGSKHYNDESVYLDKHDGYNGAAGARSQG